MAFNWLTDIIKFVGQSLGASDAKDITSEPIQRRASLYRPGRLSRQKPPHARGDYRWVNKATGHIEYIGISNDLKRRQGEHNHGGHFSAETHYFEWRKAKDGSIYEDMRKVERVKIEKHNPPRNIRGGGAGRSPLGGG